MRAQVRDSNAGGVLISRAVDADVIRLGRDASCEVATDPVAFPDVLAVHARIEAVPDGFVVTNLSRVDGTLLNNRPLRGTSPLQVGDRVRLGLKGPTVEILVLEADAARLAPIDFSETVVADEAQMAPLRGSASAQRFQVGNGGVIGRDSDTAQFLLDHPHVSRLHATLAVAGQRVVLADLGSSNGTFLNGQRMTRPARLEPGDLVEIGPFTLEFDGLALTARSRSNNIELVARGLGRVVSDRATGKPLVLIDRVNLVVRPREFVCLIGPSGSGKSTLLAMLSGRNGPDSGSVTVNGEDLFVHFEALKEQIAVVPQKDVLHDSLPLGTALQFTAELRLPNDTKAHEVRSSVRDILEDVGLTRRRETVIRQLSGGQLKRACLANEPIARPTLLFLDEVTSGLDEQTDREVMDLFRQVADGGKTVVCITHNLANVEATCHLVVILTEGGRLAFVGTPDEAKAYFKIPRLGEVYRKMAERSPDAWQARFEASPYHARYVADRLPADRVVNKPARTGRTTRRSEGGLRQAWILTRRYLAIWRGDWLALLVLFGQSVMIAVLLGLVFGDLDDVAAPAERATRTVSLLFLLGVSSYWFGCNTGAKELVKERVIFLRERAFNLRIGSYLVSKYLVLNLTGIVQAAVLFGIVRLWCHLPGTTLTQWLTLAALSVAGTALGLLISSLARSEEVATALVPMAIIPQIILAGAIVPLSGAAKGLAMGFITVYWGQQALERTLPDGDLTLLGRATGSYWAVPISVVLGHAVLVALATVLNLGRSGGKNSR
jgi:ABC-type multidrug transport system ATPase subunit/pSer/pThr/pTyr-binding forkhead associated (FHA) protein